MHSRSYVPCIHFLRLSEYLATRRSEHADISITNNISRIIAQLIKGPDTTNCNSPGLDIKPLLICDWASMPCEVYWAFYGPRNIFSFDPRPGHHIVNIVNIIYCLLQRPVALNDQIVHQLKNAAGMFAWELARFRVQSLCQCGRSLFNNREDEWRLRPEQCDAHAADGAL